MFPLMTELPFTAAQVAAATRLMLRIAHVDGAGTAEEVALIRQFYAACHDAEGCFPEFESIAASRDEGAVTATDFPDAGQREMIVALCLMVAYADGALSDAERTAVGLAADGLGIAPDRVEAILAQVKDHMLAQLARLPDAESVAAVAKELG